MLSEVNPILFSVILAAAALAAGFSLYFVATFLLKRWFRRIRVINLEIELHLLQAPLITVLPAVCMRAAIPWMRLNEKLSEAVSHGVSLILIASLGWLSLRGVHLVRDIILSRYDLDAKDNLSARKIYTQIEVIENIVNAVIVVFTIAAMLITFESIRQIGVSLLASAGVVGIVIGFAAQKTLGNFIAGIQIALTQPIRVDDVLIVEGEWGRVEEINLSYVVIRIWDLRRLVVPISYFIDKPFQNWTRTSADLLGSVFIYADYTVPVPKIREALTRILEKSPRWDKKVNVLQVTNATEQTVELRALMSAADSSTAWDLRCEVREKLLEFMQKELPGHLPRTRVSMEPLKPGKEIAGV